jgi:hypothetical protein
MADNFSPPTPAHTFAPICTKCGESLQAFGGLAISPPTNGQDVVAHSQPVTKFHICAACWPLFFQWLKEPTMCVRPRNDVWEQLHTLWGMAKEGDYQKPQWVRFQILVEDHIGPPQYRQFTPPG